MITAVVTIPQAPSKLNAQLNLEFLTQAIWAIRTGTADSGSVWDVCLENRA